MATPVQVAVVGGGAAGWFAAIAAAEADARVVLLEKTHKPLAKVLVSGGGRCNVTHACWEPDVFAQHYPRGSRELRGPLHKFGAAETVAWFEQRGVRLKTEPDGRMFPVTDSSQTIADCLQAAARNAGVQVRLGADVQAIAPEADGVRLTLAQGGALLAQRVIIATGGSPKRSGLEWLAQLGIPVVDPVPSLFTFNLPKHPVTALAGIAVPARVTLPRFKQEAQGPVLITHWGLSGPAVLRLSAWAARELFRASYQTTVVVDWTQGRNVADDMDHLRQTQGKKQTGTGNPWQLPARLWHYLLDAASVPKEAQWATLTKGQLVALGECLTAHAFQLNGKTTYKDEFVTAGGVDLRDIDFRTMQSRTQPLLHFAGEVLNMDGITGGFNFQAAWTTGWLAGQAAAFAGQ